MKKLFFAITFLFVSTVGFAQMSRELNGNGKIIKKTYDFKDFDKIQFQDLAGKAEVEVGKPFSVQIEIDENLESLLEVNNADGKLSIEFKGNKNNRLYIEKTNIRIRVSMPEISVLQHQGNSDLKVHGLIGRYFRLENNGNGNTKLSGSIDKLDIKKYGNGNVDAKDLSAKYAEVKSFGNGDVKVNVSVSLTANGTGNGDIIKTGSGKIESMSGIVGNGEVRSM